MRNEIHFVHIDFHREPAIEEGTAQLLLERVKIGYAET